MDPFTLKLANKSTSSRLQLASPSRCSSPGAERARDERSCAVPESVADGRASQYTHLEVERRASSATGARESTLRRETGQDLTLKASPVRMFFPSEPDVAQLMVFRSPCQGFGRQEDCADRGWATTRHRTR